MNEKDPHEIEIRQQAFKLFEKGKSVAQILKRIPRSRSWLFKWKKRFERDGWKALDSLSKAPAKRTRFARRSTANDCRVTHFCRKLTKITPRNFSVCA
jgi:transposase